MPDASAEILFQYAGGTTWPTTDGGWTTDPDTLVHTAGDGLWKTVGAATATRRYGRFQHVDDADVSDDPVPALEPALGRYCRLLRPDAGGTITAYGTTWSDFWWGFCAKASRRFRGKKTGWPAAGMTTLTLNGLAGLLAGITAIDAWEANPSASHEWPIFHGVPFNERGIGNCTAATYAVNGVTNVHLFDRYNVGGTAIPWTLAAAVKYLLAVFTPRHGTWALVDSSTVGDEDLPEIVYHGKNLLQILLDILSPARGVVFRATSISHVPTITLMDWAPSAGETIDATAADADVTLESDTVEAADHTLALSSRTPLASITFWYATTGSPTLAPKGWAIGTPPTEDPQSRTLRRWEISTSVIDNLRVDLVQDADGYTGERRKASAVGGGACARGAKLERGTGLRPGDATTTPLNLLTADDRAPARVFVRRSSSSTAWEDWSSEVRVSVSNNPALIEFDLDADHAYDLYKILTLSSGELRITIGVREMAPVRWSLKTTDAYRGTRDAVRIVPGGDATWIPAGTAVGVGPTGALITTAADTDTWDELNTPVLDEMGRLSEFSGRNAQHDLAWKVRRLEWTKPPGTQIAAIEAGALTPIPVQAITTTRTWTFTEGQIETAYTTTRPTRDGAVG